MDYLTLAQIKKHLNIDTQFTEDDEYIESLAEVAEQIVAQHLKQDLAVIASDYNDNLPKPIVHAMLLLIGNFYANRETVAFASAHELPLSYEYLLSPYVEYEKTNI